MSSNWLYAYRGLSGKDFTCPLCGIAQSVEPIEVLGTVNLVSESGQGYASYGEVWYPAFVPPVSNTLLPGYAIVMCKKCVSRVIVEMPSNNWEKESAVWPFPNTAVSGDIPEPVRSALIDAKRAHAADSKTGAIMSLRTVILRLQRERSVSSLKDLWNKEELSKSLFGTANEPRLWGNVIGHDDFDPEEVTPQHVAELINFVDQILDIIYGLPVRLERSREERERVEKSKEENDSSGGSGGGRNSRRPEFNNGERDT